MDEINKEYEKLIYSIINKKFYFCNNKDDLFQVGYISPFHEGQFLEIHCVPLLGTYFYHFFHCL